MILLAGFLEVIFKAVVLSGLALAVGGVGFGLVVLRPLAGQLPTAALRRNLSLVAAGGTAVLAFQAATLLIEPWALADDLGRWPVADFLATGFARAGMVHAVLGGALAAAALGVRNRGGGQGRSWLLLGALAALLAASGAPLVHGASRLEWADTLMSITVAHQVGAALWAGGLVHLLGQWLLSRRNPGFARAWPAVVARFSPFAASGVALIAVTGLVLSWRYIGSVSGLTGTAYGAMVLTKAALMGAALLLGAGNYLAVRRWRRRGDRAEVVGRVPMVEAEAGAVMVILFAAAALTSQPPAVDLLSERATLGEVAATFAPKVPRLVPPPFREMVAASQSSLDPYLRPGPLDRAQSTFNHDASGLFVLIAAIGALVDRWGKVRAARHWPLAFLGLAAFLVIIGEPNGWPLGPEPLFATLVSPAVLLHRVSTVLVVVLALFEWRVQVGGLAATRWRYAFPLLAGVGGALLLTHSHSVSALKWTYLMEVTHNAIGLLAVVLGIARWLELRTSRPGRRVYGFVWPTCMALIGVVLLFYRE